MEEVDIQQAALRFFCNAQKNDGGIASFLDHSGVTFFKDVVYGSLWGHFVEVYANVLEELGKNKFKKLADDYFSNSRQFSSRIKPNNIYIAFVEWLKHNSSREVFEFATLDTAMFLASYYRRELIYIEINCIHDFLDSQTGVFAVQCQEDKEIELFFLDRPLSPNETIGFQNYWDRK